MERADDQTLAGFKIFFLFYKSSEICDAKGVENAVDGIEYFGTAMLSAIFWDGEEGGGGKRIVYDGGNGIEIRLK